MALPALSRLAQDPDTGVRMAALRALGRLDTQEARDLLRARLREGAVVTASERVLAAGVLLSRGDRGAATVTVLDQALGSANARVRQLAIGQLRHLPDEQQALRLLVRGLADGAEPVRLHAAVELARRGDRRGLEVLRAHQGSLLAEHLMVRDALQRLDTPVPPLELAAVLGAAEQEQREAVMAAAPALLPETGLALVLYGLCDPASGVRLLAVEAAADLPGDGRLRQLLLQPARDQDGAVRGRALAALASLAVNQAAVHGG